MSTIRDLRQRLSGWAEHGAVCDQPTRLRTFDHAGSRLSHRGTNIILTQRRQCFRHESITILQQLNLLYVRTIMHALVLITVLDHECTFAPIGTFLVPFGRRVYGALGVPLYW